MFLAALLKAPNPIWTRFWITGAWDDCDQRLAELATARFLGVNHDEVAIEQIRDAIGDLANMSAGAVKPLLPPPYQL